MSRRAALQHRPACPEWQRPGFRFLPLDEHGAAIWPPGYVPQAAAGARSNARVASDARAHEHVEHQRRTATGWAGNTFDMANTPHNQAAPGMLERAPAAQAAPRVVWPVKPLSYIWLTLQCIRRRGRPITIAEAADAMGTVRSNARASLQTWLDRGVVQQVAPEREVYAHGGNHPPRDIALGPNVGAVQLRVGT